MIPFAYRSLLVTYPRAWRRQHGDVVLGTLMTVHADRDQSRPSLTERLQFAAEGLRVRIVRRLWRAPARHFADPVALGSLRHFDQGNGLIPAEREVPELEQLKANSAANRNSDVDRATAIAYSGMGMIR